MYTGRKHPNFHHRHWNLFGFNRCIFGACAYHHMICRMQRRTSGDNQGCWSWQRNCQHASPAKKPSTAALLRYPEAVSLFYPPVRFVRSLFVQMTPWAHVSNGGQKGLDPKSALGRAVFKAESSRSVATSRRSLDGNLNRNCEGLKAVMRKEIHLTHLFFRDAKRLSRTASLGLRSFSEDIQFLFSLPVRQIQPQNKCELSMFLWNHKVQAKRFFMIQLFFFLGWMFNCFLVTMLCSCSG